MMDKFLGIRRDKFDVILMVTFCFIVLLNGFALAYVVRENSKRAKEVAAVAETVLAVNCSQRAYAQSQVEQTSDLLAKSSQETFYGGITRSQLFTQLKNQRDYRDTFKGLDCRAYNGSGPS